MNSLPRCPGLQSDIMLAGVVSESTLTRRLHVRWERVDRRSHYPRAISAYFPWGEERLYIIHQISPAHKLIHENWPMACRQSRNTWEHHSNRVTIILGHVHLKFLDTILSYHQAHRQSIAKSTLLCQKMPRYPPWVSLYRCYSTCSPTVV